MSFLPPIHVNNHSRSAARLTLHNTTAMTTLLPSTTFPPLAAADRPKPAKAHGVVEKSSNKVTKKKLENCPKSVPVTSPPSTAGTKKRAGGSAKVKPTKQPPSKPTISSKQSIQQPSVPITAKTATPPSNQPRSKTEKTLHVSLSSIVNEPLTSSSITSTTLGTVSSVNTVSSVMTSELKKTPVNLSSEKIDSQTNIVDKTLPKSEKATNPAVQLNDETKLSATIIPAQNIDSLRLKDEKPKTPMHFELKTSNQFYLPKRKLVQKPVEPFTLFITEKHALARLVWLYLLESQMPFKKIPITSKEAHRASQGVPSFCKHCIFTDGDSILGQPTAIIRHICNFYTNNLLMGADTGEISQSFSWVHWAVSVLHRDLVYLAGTELKRGSHDNVTNELQKSSLDSASLYFDMLDKIFSTRLFLLGPTAWFCDSAVALVLEDANTKSLAQWPRLQEWLGRVKDQPNWNTVTAA